MPGRSEYLQQFIRRVTPVGRMTRLPISGLLSLRQVETRSGFTALQVRKRTILIFPSLYLL